MSFRYSSQDGNGPFGFGWSLGVSQISRRTDKGGALLAGAWQRRFAAHLRQNPGITPCQCRSG
nr:SpvB/TcaC N-terminal domain-containing protein [Pseudomonas sp. P42]